MLRTRRLEPTDGTSRQPDRQLRVKCREPRLRIVVGQMPLLLQLTRGLGKRLDIRPKPAARNPWQKPHRRGSLLRLKTKIAQAPMIDATVNQRVTARRTSRYTDELVRRHGQAKMEKPVIGGGDGAT